MQDIRQGARGTTKSRVHGGFDVQVIATELLARSLVRKEKRDDYFITEAGRRFLDEWDEAHQGGAALLS